MDKKREFPRFRALGEAKPATVFAEIGVGKQNLPPVSSKNGKNCKFRGRNRQKTVKTANSVNGIIRNRRKLQIPWEESSKNSKNCKFCGQNHQKTEKTGFPHPGENQNHPKTAFPNLGKGKNTPRRVPRKKILIWRWPRDPAHACFFAK